jgi:hypothetical protein
MGESLLAWGRVLACLLAIVGVSAPPAAPAAQKAALACANPALPAAILDGPAARGGGAALALIDVRAPRAVLRLAVAANDSSRDLGLMCVTKLRPRAGMIFVFAQASDWSFWMKNTLIALDQIWVEPSGKVDTVAANVPKSALDTPDDRVARRRGHGVYVIELPAGEAAADGIVAGASLVIPSLRASQ